MGLSIITGILVDFIENEPQGYQAYEVIFENINAILVKNNVAPYQEPKVMETSPLQFGGFPYSFLHHLRRFAAHTWENEDNDNWNPTAFSAEDEPSADAILEDHYSYMSSHLLTHSDVDGFYIPVALPEVLFDTDEFPVPGAMIGSSYDLLNELKSLTTHLGIEIDEDNKLTNVDELNTIISNEGYFWIEILVCVTLIDAAKFSIENKTAILFN